MLLTDQDWFDAAQALDCEVASVRAVAEVEAPRGGFLRNGDPVILFEGHLFSKLTGRQYDQSHPTISYRRWTKKHYKGGAKEYERLNLARQLDEPAALKSASWGKFQILGMNSGFCGCRDVYEFVDQMRDSERSQLLLFGEFIRRYAGGKLQTAIRARDWPEFARIYNGPAYRANKYDTKMAKAYERFADYPRHLQSCGPDDPTVPYITVRRGDTLGKLALAHMGGDLKALLKLNPQIHNPNRINVGDQIRIG